MSKAVFLIKGKWKSFSRVQLFVIPWTKFSRPRILGWAAYTFSRGSSHTRDQTQVWSCRQILCRQILYQLSHKESPRILEWVAYPFSRGSSQLRNWTRVSCIAGRLFTSWAIREAHGRFCLLQFHSWDYTLEKPSHMCSRRNHKNLYSKIICNSKALRRASVVI